MSNPNAIQARRDSRQELVDVTDALVAEFAGRLPATMVIRYVGKAREQLLRAGIRAGLAPAAEASARLRLSELLDRGRAR